MASPSLLEALQDMPDPRSPRGRSYPLPAILALIILGSAACRNTVVCLLHRVGSDSHAQAQRRLAARPLEAISLLKSQE